MFRWILFLCLLSVAAPIARAQRPAASLLQAVYAAQRQLRSASYTLLRTDTLVTGQTRQLQGRVQLRALPADTLLGFAFWAQQQDWPEQVGYDGHQGYRLDTAARTYRRLTRPAAIRNLTSEGGGRLLVPDLVRLDTSQVVRWEFRQDAARYYLTLHYPDLPAYDVRQRRKVVTLSRATLLPVVVEHRQQTLGQVQCLRYDIRNLRLNDSAADQYLWDLPFLASYRLLEATPVAGAARPGLLGQVAPPVRLTTLAGDSVKSAAWAGQVVLLDFWELWCGPCQEAWPAVAQLARRYASQGLLVYGLTHDPAAGQALQRWQATHADTFPSLRGTAQSRQAYQLSAVPLYVLLDRQGRVCFRQEGFSPALETAIQQALRP
jgi:thiol-disulfide isomerase/thioredoxin